MLTPLGLCRDISAYDSSLDYRRDSPFAGYPIHYNYFPEGNSTYCEPDDAKCSTCREKSFTVGNRNPSLYCTGTDDCVCVAVCESDSWRNDTLEQLRELFNETGEQPVCPIADNDTYSYTASSSEAGSSLLTGSSKDVYSADDECKWYQNTTYCDTPRSCYDCLNSPVYSGQACTITPAGYCASMTEYDYTYDYRRVLSMSGKHFFPSTNTSYCGANDPVCEECRSSAAFSSAANGQANLTAYCVGTDDCVCVAFCESSNWSAIVRDETCNVAAQATDSSGTRIPTIGIAAIILVSCVLLFAGIMQGITLVRKQSKCRGTISMFQVCAGSDGCLCFEQDGEHIGADKQSNALDRAGRPRLASVSSWQGGNRCATRLSAVSAIRVWAAKNPRRRSEARVDCETAPRTLHISSLKMATGIVRSHQDSRQPPGRSSNSPGSLDIPLAAGRNISSGWLI